VYLAGGIFSQRLPILTGSEMRRIQNSEHRTQNNLKVKLMDKVPRWDSTRHIPQDRHISRGKIFKLWLLSLRVKWGGEVEEEKLNWVQNLSWINLELKHLSSFSPSVPTLSLHSNSSDSQTSTVCNGNLSGTKKVNNSVNGPQR
jgi:hypothetical protein